MRTLTFPLLFLLLTTIAPFGLADTPAPLGRRLAAAYGTMGNDETAIVIVYLTDKGPRGRTELWSAADLLSPRSLARRARVGKGVDFFTGQDLPVDASYLAAISRTVTRTRHALKWFNAVSAEATRAQIDELRRLPFVREIDLVGRWPGAPEPELPEPKEAAGAGLLTGTQAHLLNYGASITQNDQIDVPEVHDLGVFGEGVTVAVFDNGFRLLTHESFASMNIIAQYDFVDHKVSVIPNNPSTGFGSHGVNTLSTIGGYKPGQLIGPAFRSDYILLRTENDSSETPVEEDNWAAGIEWADSIGVDVTSTSLGYLTYDFPYASWSWVNMDGNTTLITQAADHAASLGIVVVNSAGNAGPGNGLDNTLGAPSDGDSVIAAGAVTSAGVRASFSSVGPTTDVPSRIKPDVMAMGVSVRVASSTNPSLYGSSNGTSFSCPLSAGVAALILSANPTLGPMQVRDAMRNTANNAASPNNQYGWGILDADSAVRYFGIVPMARLSGAIFQDHNGNGVRDGGEPGLSGETVILSGPTTDTAVSGADGAYSFGDLAIGSYALSVATASGWIVTTPPGALGIPLLHRDTVSGFNAGILEAGQLNGVVYDDSDGNGVKDPGEPGLGGWTILVEGPSPGSTVTDTSGAWSFATFLPGAYGVIQAEPPGWIQVSPGGYAAYSVTMTGGLDTAGFDFGNYSSPANAYPVADGWNLLSLPVLIPDALADSVYPNATSAVSVYQGGYSTADTIPNGRGYWVKFPSAHNILLEGSERTVDTVELSTGWNLIGTLTGPVNIGAIVQSPPGIIQSGFYAFRNNAYQNVNVDSFLHPHGGYWVKSAAPGGLILESSYAWVGHQFTGGCQCDTGCGYDPPDTEAELTGAGVPVLAIRIHELPICHACDCPAYDSIHYALIRQSDIAAAGGLGYVPMNPPGW